MIQEKLKNWGWGESKSKGLPRKVHPKIRFKLITLKKEFSLSIFVIDDRLKSGPLEMFLLGFLSFAKFCKFSLYIL